MYVFPNAKNKKELKKLLDEGKEIAVYSPGPFPCPTDGEVSIEGPHYPKAHTWYARAVVKNGYLVSFK